MDTELRFEHMIRLFLGDKADNIAGQANHPTSRRNWLRKVVADMSHYIDKIEMPERQRQTLSANLDRLDAILKESKDPTWDLTYRLFALCGRLLGYDYSTGARCYTPLYYQTKEQYYTGRMLEGGDVLEGYYDEKDFVAVRARLIKQLKEEGFTDQKIALIMNISEARVRKLKKEP